MPYELEKLALSVIETTPDLQEVFAKEKSSTFQCYELPVEVKNWIKDNIPLPDDLLETDFRIHVLWSEIKIHSDYARKTALNYVFETGGDNVSTEWYSSDKTIKLHSEVIPERTWHSFDTETPHGISNIMSNKPRIGITITVEKRPMFDKIKIY